MILIHVLICYSQNFSQSNFSWLFFYSSRFYFLSFFDINSFIDNREMRLSVLQRAKKFRSLEWLDKIDKNREPRVLIWWSLLNSFYFNLYRFWEHICHDLFCILWCCRRGYDFDLRLDMLFSEFHTIKLLLTLLLLIKILFCIIFWYNSIFDNWEMCLSILLWAKKFRCLEWLDKMDQNRERIIMSCSLLFLFIFWLWFQDVQIEFWTCLIWWSLLNSSRFKKFFYY
jgi:hypothetical protein